MRGGPHPWSAIAAVGAVLASTAPAHAQKTFLTHLALLDRLTREATAEMLDELTVPAGQEVYVLPSGSHEGNGFVADIVVDELVRRGCQVRLLDPGTPASEPAEIRGARTPAQPPPPAGGGATEPDTTGAPADTTGWGAPADTSMVGAGGMGTLDQGSGAGATTGAGAQGAMDREPDAGGLQDTTGVAPGEPGDSAGAGARGGVPRQALPPTPRLYPEGRILEFRVLEFGVQYASVKRRYVLLGPAVVRRIGGVYLQGSWVQGPQGTILDVGSGQSHHYDVLSGRSVNFAEGASYPFLKPTAQPLQLGRFVEPVAVVGIITSLVYLFYQNQN